MPYHNQIKILESKLVQLKNNNFDTDNMMKIWAIETEIRKLRRLEWEETYERVNLDDER